MATDLRKQKQNDLDVSEHRRADEALRTSEARFRSVLENSRDVIYRVNVQTGHYDYISPSVETVVGFSPNELASMDVETSQAMIHPDDAPAMRDAVARLETTGTADVEYRQKAKDGDYRWLSNHMSLVKERSGRPLYRNGNIRDVTEQKQAECALRQSEARHRALFDNSIDAIFATAPDGRVFAANQAACQTFGMTEEELIRAGREGITDGSDPRHGPALAERARSGRLRRELGYVRKDGTKFTAEVSSVILPDRTTSFVILRDITERKRAEETLRESEERFRAIFEHASDAILVTDPAGSGKVLSANPAACRMFGYSAEEFVGLDRQSHIETNDPRLAEMLGRRDGQGRAVGEVTCRRKDGGTFSAEFSTALLTDQTGQRRSIAIIRDITEHKQAEEALRRFELLASHTRDIVLFMRREDGRILEANVAAQNAYGYNREEMLSLSIRDLRAPDTRSLSEEQMGIADVRGILFETVHQRKDGSTFPVDVSSRGATIDGTRTLISVVRDITERRRAEKELRGAEQRLESLLENSPLAVIEWSSADYRIVRWSDEATKVFGWTAEETVGKRIDELNWVHAEDWPLAAQMMGDMLSGKCPRNVCKNRNVRKDGTVIHCEWYNSTLHHPDGKFSVLSLVLDVTERKRAELALERSNLKLAEVFRESGTSGGGGVQETPRKTAKPGETG